MDKLIKLNLEEKDKHKDILKECQEKCYSCFLDTNLKSNQIKLINIKKLNVLPFMTIKELYRLFLVNPTAIKKFTICSCNKTFHKFCFSIHILKTNQLKCKTCNAPYMVDTNNFMRINEKLYFFISDLIIQIYIINIFLLSYLINYSIFLNCSIENSHLKFILIIFLSLFVILFISLTIKNLIMIIKSDIPKFLTFINFASEKSMISKKKNYMDKSPLSYSNNYNISTDVNKNFLSNPKVNIKDQIKTNLEKIIIQYNIYYLKRNILEVCENKFDLKIIDDILTLKSRKDKDIIRDLKFLQSIDEKSEIMEKESTKNLIERLNTLSNIYNIKSNKLVKCLTIKDNILQNLLIYNKENLKQSSNLRSNGGNDLLELNPLKCLKRKVTNLNILEPMENNRNLIDKKLKKLNTYYLNEHFDEENGVLNKFSPKQMKNNYTNKKKKRYNNETLISNILQTSDFDGQSSMIVQNFNSDNKYRKSAHKFQKLSTRCYVQKSHLDGMNQQPNILSSLNLNLENQNQLPILTCQGRNPLIGTKTYFGQTQQINTLGLRNLANNSTKNVQDSLEKSCFFYKNRIEDKKQDIQDMHNFSYSQDHDSNELTKQYKQNFKNAPNTLPDQLSLIKLNNKSKFSTKFNQENQLDKENSLPGCYTCVNNELKKENVQNTIEKIGQTSSKNDGNVLYVNNKTFENSDIEYSDISDD